MKFLLLQGPLGPFFKQLASVLIDMGHEVHRIHFNAGDRFYSGVGQCTDYTDSIENWPQYLAQFIKKHQIDTLILYGDCRKHHSEAVLLAKNLGKQCKVLEEGYLRPDWITCEDFGVNAASTVLTKHDFLNENRVLNHQERIDLTGDTFARRFLFASLYFHAMWWQRHQFPHYQQHHINASPWYQGACWIRSYFRKLAYKKQDSKILNTVINQFDQRYFLLPLQVATDSQIKCHSNFGSIAQLIESTIDNFALHAPKNNALVIKHHPIDRGHTQYSDLIEQKAISLGVKDRVFYGHELHLPTLLKHTKGIVTLNSTVGISGLIHTLPVKVLGKAFWDHPKLTSDQTLDNFWQNPKKPEAKDIEKFLATIRHETQIKGSFYKHTEITLFALAQKLIAEEVNPNYVLDIRAA